MQAMSALAALEEKETKKGSLRRAFFIGKKKQVEVAKQSMKPPSPATAGDAVSFICGVSRGRNPLRSRPPFAAPDLRELAVSIA
jgi:hypothetical protein